MFPSPRITIVLTLNNCLSTSSHGGADPTHGLSDPVQAYHSHLNLKAQPKQSRSSTPRPPSSFGNKTCFQFTKQCPPFACSAPLHSNPLLSLSIFFRDHFWSTPSVPNYKPFQESWRVKSFQSLTKIIEKNIKIYNII